MSRTRGTRVVVLGYIVRGPLGGLAWHHLQYVLGLRDMGFDVMFVEDSDDYASCYDPSSNSMTVDPTYGLRFIDSLFQRVGAGDAWGFFDAHQGHWHGPIGTHAREWCRNADILLNVSGVNPLREWTHEIPLRMFIDTDPVFTQIRHLTDRKAFNLAASHTHFASFGERMGMDDCRIPSDGFSWIPTRQPVVTELWDMDPVTKLGKFTTVMQWDSYAPREYGGTTYGMKGESFKPFTTLPERTGATLELAMGSDSAPRDLLSSLGWSIVDPMVVAGDPFAFRAYIHDSMGEFSVAKHGYVASKSGWFSERSANYLASGRPVVAQDTGWTDLIPSGEGLLSFENADDAEGAIRNVKQAFRSHSRAARAIAEEYFGAHSVLDRLLRRAGAL